MLDLFKPKTSSIKRGKFIGGPINTPSKELRYTLLKCPHCFSSNVSEGSCWKGIPVAQSFWCSSCSTRFVVEGNNRDYGTTTRDKQHYIASYVKIYKTIDEYKNKK